ncbi:CD63 antigen-like [Panonychus citri]|uniref:CD63 antigen-like n=1 Tax=Panonychus citri TaxID=50023 RepID=UPI00230828A3|nr:CD63 antigen-like [Panonychus citri]
MVQGGMSCVKYILGVFNFAFFLSSIGIITLCVRAIGMPESAEKILDVDNRHLIVMIAASILLLIISFLGCWGALRENNCMLISYGILLLIIIAIEVAVGTLAFLYSNKVEEMAYKGMRKYIDEYQWDSDNSTTNKIIDDLQKNVKCCGAYNYTDYESQFGDKLPLSCCGKLKSKSAINLSMSTPGSTSSGSAAVFDGYSSPFTGVTNNETCSSADAFKDGCAHKLWDLMIKYYGPIGGILIGVAVIQLLGFILSCAFAHSIKKDYEVV